LPRRPRLIALLLPVCFLPGTAAAEANSFRFQSSRVEVAVHRAASGAFLNEEDGRRLYGSLSARRIGGITWQPRARWALECKIDGRTGDDEETRATFHTLDLRAPLAPQWDLALGRFPHRYGSGELGNLLLGRTAPPLWQLEVTRTPRREAAGSSFWQHGVEADAFLAFLDDEHRTISDPLLLGHRLTLYPRVELGLSVTRTILFGGRDRTRRLAPGDLIDILLARHENQRGERGPGDSDQKLSYLAEGQLPTRLAARLGLEHARAFYEYAGEDALRHLVPTARGRHFGAELGWRGLSFRGEIASTHTGANRWYQHTVYRDAYFYRGLPLGLPMGGDAFARYIRVRAPRIVDREVGASGVELAARLETFGIYSRNRERRLTLSGSVDLRPKRLRPIESIRFEAGGSSRLDQRREPTAPPMISSLFRVSVALASPLASGGEERGATP